MHEDVIDMVQVLKEHLPAPALVEVSAYSFIAVANLFIFHGHFQLHNLGTSLRESPAQVNIGGYFVLNKSLLIQVGQS